MSLTVAQKAFCALLFGAGVGTGYVAPAVKTTIARKIAELRQPVKAAAPVKRKALTLPPAEPVRIMDAPLCVQGLSFSDSALVPPVGALAGVEFAPPAGGIVAFPPAAAVPPTFPPAVPEPPAWLLWIGGFGCVGLSIRKRRTQSEQS